MESCSLIPLEIHAPIVTDDDHKFLAAFEQRVERTIQDHRLFTRDDKVLVGVSGGKDSTVLLYVLKKLGYLLEAVTVDVHIGCYTKENLVRIQQFCDEQGVKLHVKLFRDVYGHSVCYIKDTVSERQQKVSSCTVCGVLRRRILNQVVRDCGAAVIATGHNLDDEAGSVWMNMLRNYQEQCSSLGPTTGKQHTGFIPRVKPLYFIPESDIIRYSKLNAFRVSYEPCPCGVDAFRASMKSFFKDMASHYPNAKEHLVTHFLKNKQAMRRHFQKLHHGAGVQQCQQCGEPAKDTVCRSCALLGMMHA